MNQKNNTKLNLGIKKERIIKIRDKRNREQENRKINESKS